MYHKYKEPNLIQALLPQAEISMAKKNFWIKSFLWFSNACKHKMATNKSIFNIKKYTDKSLYVKEAFKNKITNHHEFSDLKNIA